ncbi:MAG: ATP-binding cassette domain-containing protein, partial [bacterium]|nr:ATP-binding cassette domain-containing protein [bacterium]
ILKPVVVVNNASKKYSMNANKHLDYGIRDLFTEIFALHKTEDLRDDEFWAVKNISFTLYPGDTLGLIGRNGCGKTTTLRLLAGLTKLDTGNIFVNGRVQSLIALGTGFNPNLSGRENILNSAAMLGISKKETREILEEVIDFAELDEFIESPVSTYSSGMKARLGFSVAIHLKPDILLIDEILSVGDYAFQVKSFGKLQQLKNNGVTIVLVSHSHNQIVHFCEQAIWLSRGATIKNGPSKDVVEAYLKHLEDLEIKKKGGKKPGKEKAPVPAKGKNPNSIYGNNIYDEFDKIKNLEVELLQKGQKIDSFYMHESVMIRYRFDLIDPVTRLNVNLVIYRKSDGFHLTKISSQNSDALSKIRSGHVCCEIEVKDVNLNPGNYTLLIAISDEYVPLYRNVVQDFYVKLSDKVFYRNSVLDLNYSQRLTK